MIFIVPFIYFCKLNCHNLFYLIILIFHTFPYIICQKIYFYLNIFYYLSMIFSCSNLFYSCSLIAFLFFLPWSSVVVCLWKCFSKYRIGKSSHLYYSADLSKKYFEVCILSILFCDSADVLFFYQCHIAIFHL